MAGLGPPMIEVTRLTVIRGGRAIVSVPHWQVETGKAALVLGPSGSGKTTLLHALAGLLTPGAGAVRIGGRDLAALNAAARDRFRGATIGLVFQTARLMGALTVSENLALALRLAGKPQDSARIASALARLDLAHRARARPQALSTGESQRAAIARAVIARPALLLADEPTAALDDAHAEAALALMQSEAAAYGATLVIATHDARVKSKIAQRLDLAGPAP